MDSFLKRFFMQTTFHFVQWNFFQTKKRLELNSLWDNSPKRNQKRSKISKHISPKTRFKVIFSRNWRNSQYFFESRLEYFNTVLYNVPMWFKREHDFR